MNTKDFDYDLPAELIAQFPAKERDQSRMMVLDRKSGECEILPFAEISNFLTSGDAMIYNDTKVMKARLYGRKNGNSDGAKFEILLTSVYPNNIRRWSALLKPGKRAVEGTKIFFVNDRDEINSSGDYCTVLGRGKNGEFVVEFANDDPDSMLLKYGHIPLPPYITRGDSNADGERYQTIFAEKSGAVAAPTAGLHFSPAVLEKLRIQGVNRHAITLHVGPGTFKPVSEADLTKHKMHSEQFFLEESTADLINQTRSAGKNVLAVGTTTVRVLESCWDGEKVVPRRGQTDIFIYPPYEPKAEDMLLTNFHLPQSTLLMLVSTFASREIIMAAYAKAIEARMRFYSYGDCMLLK